ncbi:MAG: signal peptidase II [Chloroflexota bacterium]
MNDGRDQPVVRLSLESVKCFLATHWKVYLLFFLIAGLVVFLDQWTKGIVRLHVPLGADWMPWDWLAPLARVRHWYNTGAAFGLFQGHAWVFMLLAVLVSSLLVYYIPQTTPQDWPMRLAMALWLGGAIGNLIDRIRFDGRVTDFISVGTFPVFNIADSSISIGVAVMILWVWLQERANKRIKMQQLAINSDQDSQADIKGSSESG